MSRIRVLLSGIALLFVGVAITPAGAVERNECGEVGGTLTVGISGFNSLDPFLPLNDWNWYAITQVSSMLFNRQWTEPVGELATSWDISPDGTTYTFHLRKGVMWHDGNEVFPEGQSREVTAHDVVYSIDRYANLETSSWPADIANIYESVEAIDDYTVVLKLSARDAIIYEKARGLTTTAIVAKEAIEHFGDTHGQNLIGSGPFELVSFSPDDEIVLKRNEDFYTDVCLDGVIFKALPDAPAALIALEAGDIDYWGSVTPGDNVEGIITNPNQTLNDFGCPVATRTVFSLQSAPYNDVRFRKAFTFMRDGNAVNAALRGDTHVPPPAGLSGLGGTAGPGVTGYVEGLYDEFFQYNPELAKQLLDEMGIVDSDGDGWREFEGETLVVPSHVWSGYPFEDYTAAVVQAGKEIGLKIEPNVVDSGTYFAIRGEKPGVYFGQGWCGEGGLEAVWGEGGWFEPMGSGDQNTWDWVAQSGSATAAGRKELLQNVTRYVAEKYWAPSWGFFQIFTAHNNYVKNFDGGEWMLNLNTVNQKVWIAEEERW